MSSLWAVTKGSYSDYRVLCICDSKERAKRIASLPAKDSWSDDRNVEEILFFDRDPVTVTTYSISEELLDDGTTHAYREDIRSEWEFDMLYPERNRPAIWRWVRAPYIENRGGRLDVSGTDLERVRKVFSDRKAMLRSDDAMRAKRESHG